MRRSQEGESDGEQHAAGEIAARRSRPHEDKEGECRHDGRRAQHIDCKSLLRQRDHRAEEVPQENSRPAVQALFADVAAEKAEYPRAGAEIGEIERRDRGDEGEGKAPVPAPIERGSGHQREVLDQCAGTEGDAGKDRRAPFGSQEGEQQKGNGDNVDVAAARELPHR